jgi:uncharacterized protein (TIGR02145 family)
MLLVKTTMAALLLGCVGVHAQKTTGLTARSMDYGTVAYADAAGKTVVGPIVCDTAYPFLEGYAPVMQYERLRWIDATGNLLFPNNVVSEVRISPELFLLSYPNNQFSLFNAKTKKEMPAFPGASMVIPVRPDSASASVLLAVNFATQSDSELGYVYDEYGDILYDPETGEPIYDYSASGSSDQWYLYTTDLRRISSYSMNGEYGTINYRYRDVPMESEGDTWTYQEYMFDKYRVLLVDQSSFNFNGKTVGFRAGEFYGAIDLTGRVVKPFIYQNAEPNVHGSYLVFKNGLYGWLDGKGANVITPQFPTAQEFEVDGFALVADGQGLWGLIDKSGNWVLKPEYYSISALTGYPFFHRVVVNTDGKYGVLGRSGKFFVAPDYDEELVFSYRGIALAKKNGNGGLLDTTGREILPLAFQNIFESYGCYIAVEDGKFGVYDPSGKQVIPHQYEGLQGIGEVEDKRVFLGKKNGKMGVVDQEGDENIPFEFNKIEKRNGFLLAEKDGKFGLYSIYLPVFLPAEYDEIKTLDYGFLARKGNSVEYYNSDLATEALNWSEPGPVVTDNQGNTYGSVLINYVSFSNQDLRVTANRDGSPLKQAQTNAEWVAAAQNKQPAWCWYQNPDGSLNKNIILYNGFAAQQSEKFVPTGWHHAYDEDWDALFNGMPDMGYSDYGGFVKSMDGWKDNPGYVQGTGIDVRPTGYRFEDGTFSGAGFAGAWWGTSSDESYTEDGDPYSTLSYKHFGMDSQYYGTGYSPLGAGMCIRIARNYE